jgi:hypothetical protein
VHIVEVHCQSKRPAIAGAGVGINPPADLWGFECLAIWNERCGRTGGSTNSFGPPDREIVEA